LSTSKEKLLLKYFLLIFTLFLAFTDFGLTLLIIAVINIPLIRKTIFGRLVLDTDKKPWLKVETYEYMTRRFIDIFYPKTKPVKGVVLFAHGGGWISGYRRQPNNMSWYRFLVSRGFVVAAIGYGRGYINDIEKLVEELIAAIQFLKKTIPDLAEKISLMGLSAGGHLALLTGLRCTESVEKIIAYYAPCDLMDIWQSDSLFARFSAMATIKKLPSKSEQVYERYSPVNYVSHNCNKILLVHGMKDSVVPYMSSVKMFKTLRQYGCKAQLLLHPNGNHGFEFVLKDQKTAEILEKTVRFLEE